MASNSEEEDVNLNTIFQEGLDLYNNLGNIDEPTNSPIIQVRKYLPSNFSALKCYCAYYSRVM